MAHKFTEIAFTPTIRELQRAAGSRESYATLDLGDDYNHQLGEKERQFIAARDSFYMASVSETGWPYLQHRGGPKGFLKVLDAGTLGFADYSGNRQYISTGNLRTDNRVALFLMDYPNQRRLKLLGRVKILEGNDAALDPLRDKDAGALVERGLVITVEAFDWNCPQHITPRFTLAELDALAVPKASAEASSANVDQAQTPSDAILGDGPLELEISGLRQLTPRVRAVELRHPKGKLLPKVEPGAHLLVPIRLPNGELIERHYSIASNPARRDSYEIAVLRKAEGRGGSQALHDSFQMGTRLRTTPPANHFSLHDDARPALLIAGGIGITPIKAMAQGLLNRGVDFALHYSGRSRAEMAYRDRLERLLEHRLHLHPSDEGNRVNLVQLLAEQPKDALIYACGPHRLLSAVQQAGQELGFAPSRIRLEAFS